MILNRIIKTIFWSLAALYWGWKIYDWWTDDISVVAWIQGIIDDVCARVAWYNENVFQHFTLLWVAIGVIIGLLVIAIVCMMVILRSNTQVLEGFKKKEREWDDEAKIDRPA